MTYSFDRYDRGDRGDAPKRDGKTKPLSVAKSLIHLKDMTEVTEVTEVTFLKGMAKQNLFLFQRNLFILQI